MSTLGVAAVFVVVAAGVAHLAFSRFGFNPTDDGLILAGARRLLDGEVPHREFVSVRPILSLALHVPELALGGQRCLIHSRLVFWLEMASFSVVWAMFLGTPQVVVFALLIMALSTQVFPPMAWHTVDALLLATIGLFVLPSSWGYILIGVSGLCRQNFLLLVPVTLVFGISPSVGWALVPAALYGVIAVALHAGHDLLQQLGTYHARVTAFIGVKKFLNLWTVGGAIAGLMGMQLKLGWLFVGIPVAAAMLIVLRGRADWSAYLVFGTALGPAAASGAARSIALVALAWISSLSIGYRYPSLMLGPLAAFLVLQSHTRIEVVWVVTVVVVALISWARLAHSYGDQPAWRLGCQLGEVLPGGGGIRTSTGIYRFLADLQKATSRAQELAGRYALVPDVPAAWMLSEQVNPLSCDWPQDTELGSPALRGRLLSEVAEPGLAVIAQKYRARSAHRGDELFAEPPAVLKAVRSGRPPVCETDLFEIYLPGDVSDTARG